LLAHRVQDSLKQAVARVLEERPADPILAISLALKQMAASRSFVDAHHHFYDPVANDCK